MSPDQPEDVDRGQPETSEVLIDALRIETVFTDRRVLVSIASKLLAEGLVSGYVIEPIEGGYVAKGRRVAQRQYALRVLIPAQDEEKAQRIREIMEGRIREYWDTPFTVIETVKATPQAMEFVKNAASEHQQYVHERRVKWTVTCVAAALIATLLSVLGKNFLESREQDIRRAELERIAADLRALEGQIADDMRGIDSLLTQGRPLTPLPSDMAAINPYLETDAAERHTRELREKVDHLIQVLEMDKNPPKEGSGGTLPRGVRRRFHP